LLGTSVLSLSGCALASMQTGYTKAEQQTVQDLAPSKYTPRSVEERQAILTQDLFAQAAFWSREYDLNPADLEAAVNLSSTLRRLGNPGKSIEVAQHTRALYPNDVDLMTEMGASYIANNQPRKALKIVDTALRLRPQTARLWSLKGAALDQVEQFKSARQHYTKALQLAPNDPGIMANVGLSYALEGDPRTAEIWLRRAVNMPGASASARQNLALVLGLQNKFNEAEKWAKQDLDNEAATNNLAYLRSLRGASLPVPANIIPAKTAPKAVGPAAKTRTYGQINPNPNFGTTLTMAGDPSQNATGPKTASDIVRAKLLQKASAGNPQSVTRAQAVNPENVLNKIAQNNQAKRTLAQQQQAQLAARAQAQMQAQAQMRAQAYPPYGYPGYGYGIPIPPPQNTRNYPAQRAPARPRN